MEAASPLRRPFVQITNSSCFVLLPAHSLAPVSEPFPFGVTVVFGSAVGVRSAPSHHPLRACATEQLLLLLLCSVSAGESVMDGAHHCESERPPRRQSATALSVEFGPSDCCLVVLCVMCSCLCYSSIHPPLLSVHRSLPLFPARASRFPRSVRPWRALRSR